MMNIWLPAIMKFRKDGGKPNGKIVFKKNKNINSNIINLQIKYKTVF
jgi:hypothetical protein